MPVRRLRRRRQQPKNQPSFNEPATEGSCCGRQLKLKFNCLCHWPWLVVCRATWLQSRCGNIAVVTTSPNSTSVGNLEIIFQDIQIRASENWSFVQALRECFAVALPSLGTALVPYLDSSVRTTMGAHFPPISERLNQQILQGMATQKEAFAKSVIDAATIVFVQATLDSAINEYLVLLAQADPSVWEGDLKDETVRLGEIQSASYADLLKEKAVTFSRSLATKSLSRKVQLILDHCCRDDIELSPPDFHFDPPRLKAFDDSRHAVAHGRGMGVIVDNMDELLLFLRQTLSSVEAVIGARLGFKRNPARQLDKAPEIQLRNVTL